MKKFFLSDLYVIDENDYQRKSEELMIKFLDCDLYESAVSVLNFVKEALIGGCIIAFDDWFCFDGDPRKGEQRAFSEFLGKNKDISVSEYLNFGWHGKSFIVHNK